MDTIRSRTVHSRLVSSTAWLVIGTGILQGATFATSIFTARILGVDVFGAYGIIQGTVVTFGILAGMGLGLTATKYIAQYRNCDINRVSRIIGLCTAIAIISGVLSALLFSYLAPSLAAHALKAPHLARALRVSSLLLVFNAWAGVQTGILAGFEAFREIAKVNAIRGAVTLPAGVLGALFWGLDGAIWALAVAAALSCLVALPALQKCNRQYSVALDWRGSWREIDVLWHFSLPAVLSSSLVGPVTWVANSILVHQRNGYVEMGILTAANQFQLCLVALPTLIQRAVLPILSSEQNDTTTTSGYKRAIDLTQVTCMLAALPTGTLLVLFGEPLLRIFGKSFAGAYPVLLGLVLGSVVSMVGGAVGAAIAARGRMWQGTMFNAIWGGVLLVIVWAFTSRLGAAAYSLGYAMAHIVLAVGVLYILRKELSGKVIIRVYATAAYMIALIWMCILTSQITREIICAGIIASLVLSFPLWRRSLTFRNLLK